MKNKFNYLLILFLIIANPLHSRDFIIVQSTTSTASTGFLDYVSDIFYKESGIEVRAVAVGTGQAIKNAMRGDADLLLVHSKKDEIKFIENGFGIERFDLMYNDFIIVGPKSDPAQIKNLQDLSTILKKILKENYTFISRDDNSGTHVKELSLWANYNLDPEQYTNYVKTGSGMLSTLNISSEMNGYTLTDRGSWIAFQNKTLLDILYENDNLLFNPYGIIALNPDKFPHVEYTKANQFIEWILSKKGKRLIEGFRVSGKQLFYTYK